MVPVDSLGREFVSKIRARPYTRKLMLKKLLLAMVKVKAVRSATWDLCIYYNTKNQQRSLEIVSSHLNEKGIRYGVIEDFGELLIDKTYFIRPLVFFRLLQSIILNDSILFRRVFLTSFARLIKSDFKNLSMVCLSNDHNDRNNWLIENYKTIYIQHAAVSSAFPLLRSTYSLLDGTKSMDTYSAIGDVQKSQVYLTGRPLEFPIIEIETDKPILCFINEYDEISMIGRKCPFDITFILHPRLNVAKASCLGYRCLDNMQWRSIKIARASHVLVTNTSAVLEIYFISKVVANWIGKLIGLEDYYGFTHSGMIRTMSSFTDFLNYPVADTDFKKNALYWNAYYHDSSYVNIALNSILDEFE